ncbi:MAG: class I SAM-dependent methyltransferase [Rhizobiaceae bacterium]|nr:class I SAM-dependent methyltransferase [Rhizobiaceae bacterium]
MIAGPVSAHADLMDRNYRFQRHVYDLTRKFYLLGRDKLIRGLAPPHGGSVLEIGCGTGRNLVLAAGRYPDARLFGLDISAEMLATATSTIARKGLAARTRLARGDAAAFEARELFGEPGFDRIYISYALSMIPAWQSAIEAALAALRPEGSLHIVDFGQQARLPRWFRDGLHGWLRNYHVTPRATLEAELAKRALEAGRPLAFDSLYRDYAWLAVIGPVRGGQPTASP